MKSNILIRHKQIELLITIILIGIMPLLLAFTSCNQDKALVSINWVDCIKFNDITYLREPQTVTFDESILTLYDVVKFKTSMNIDDPNYKIKNGDAAYLEAGTEIYSITGYSTNYRLAAGSDHDLLIYEADTSPDARQGGDLLDIGGKVEHIAVCSGTDGAELAVIGNQSKIDELVRMILAAPVDQSVLDTGDEQYGLKFYLNDGTSSLRTYWLDIGILSRGIQLPQEFSKIIRLSLPYAKYPEDVLDGTQWKLTSLNGSPPAAGSYVSLYFSQGSMWGSAGVNMYGVRYLVQSPDMIIYGEGDITQVGGPEHLVNQEKEYTPILFNASYYEIKDSNLWFFDVSRSNYLIFERLPEYPVNFAELIGTEWQLSAINDEALIDGLSINLKFDSDQAAGESGCFVYTLYYDADLLQQAGDNIRWGNSSRRTGELPEAQEHQALSYLDRIAVAATFNLTGDRLEIFTARGDTLVYTSTE